MDIAVSVIVPVYNVEAYIRTCLQSIAEQSFSSFEVLLVDDGSTDASGGIAEEFARTDSRFRVIHKENGGLSSARNTGMGLAQGKYVCFVDSDDYISPDYLELLYQKAHDTGADMVFADFHEVDEDGERIIKETGKAPREGTMERSVLLHALTDVGECHYSTTVVVAWNKMVRTELMRRHPYPEGVLHEDEFVIMPLLLDCKHVEWVNADVYAYRQRSGSIMQNPDAAMRHLQVLKAYRKRIDLCRNLPEKGLARDMKRAYFWNIEIWYFLMREKYGVPCRKLYGVFTRRMWGALIQFHSVWGRRKVMEYMIFAIWPEYYLRNYFK